MTGPEVATASTLPEVTNARVLLEAAWRVSSRSGSGGGNCVEAGPLLDGSARVAVRDSKDRNGPALVYRTATWSAFLTSLKQGHFDA